MRKRGPAQDERNVRGAAVCAVVLCAGQGTRMGAERNKVLLPLAGKPIVVHSIEACLRARAVTDVLLVAHPHELEQLRELVQTFRLARVRAVIPGGMTRHGSELCALNTLRQDIEGGSVGIVLMHDGARPLVRTADISRLIRAARVVGGALLATPAAPHETVARVAADETVQTVYPPDDVWHAQTPQAFAASALLRAYDAAARVGFEGTDTATTYERLGLPVQVVTGSPDNIKITTPLDLARAEMLLSASAPPAARIRHPVSGQR